MKKNIFIITLIGLIGIAGGFFSCSPDYETDFHVSSLVVSHKNQGLILLPLEGGNKEIPVQTNIPLDKWTATSNAPWCEVSKAEGLVTVNAGENNNYKERKALVTIAYGHQKYDIQVRQFGKELTLEIVENENFKMVKNIMTTTVEPTAETLEIPLRTNLVVDHVLIPDTCNWVHYTPSGRGESDNSEIVYLTLNLDQNTELEERYCMLILQSSLNYNVTKELLIKQDKRGFIVVPIEGKTEFEVEDAGDIVRVPFGRNGGDDSYTVTVAEDALEWIQIRPKTRGISNDELVLIVQPNEVEEPRTGKVTIKSNNEEEESSFVVTINQKAFVPVPPNNVVNLMAIPGEGFIKLSWDKPEKANYSKVVITYLDTPRRMNVRQELTDKNVTTCKLDSTFAFAGEYEFTVKTYGPTGLETASPLTVKSRSLEWSEKKEVTLTESMITANATQTNDGGGIPALVDRKVNTYYHSFWGPTSPGKKPHYLQFNFSQPIYKKFTIEYVGRHNGDGGGDIKRTDILVSDTGGDNDSEWHKIGEITYTLPSGRGQPGTANGYVTADKNYNYVRFLPTARRSKDPLNGPDPSTWTGKEWWNMAEIYIYEIHDEAWIIDKL